MSRMVEAYERVDASTPPGLPKYLRVCAMIETEVAKGNLQPGDRLPSETELASMLPASLGTVQKALRTLAQRNVLVRLHGKGTFITESRVEENKLWHLRFLDQNSSLLPVYVQVNDISTVTEDGPWVGYLGRYPYYIRVKRTMNIAHQFTVSACFYIQGPRFKSLLDVPQDKIDGTSLRSELVDKFGMATVRVRGLVGIEKVPPDIAKTISLTADSIAMICEVVGQGFRESPLYYQRYWIPPNPYRLEMREEQP